MQAQLEEQRHIREVLGDPAAAGERLVLGHLGTTDLGRSYGETTAALRSLSRAVDSLKNTAQGIFATNLSGLAFAYSAEKPKNFALKFARALRDGTQSRAYEILVGYREAAAGRLSPFPELLETRPRITPLPGHTPERVNASAVWEAPDKAKVVYEASPDAGLHSYQLRGNVGDEYSDEDAVVIATNAPGAPREFVTPFGLGLPGARGALKVYVILTTGNEAGSAALFVTRPANVQPLAA